jgi:glutaconate CoA-transferase, subunit B
MPPSQLEIDAVLVSRLLRDDDRVLIGAGLDAPRAGALLAALTHAPGLALCQALGWVDTAALSEPRPPRLGMDIRDAAGAEALLLDDEAYDDVRRLSSFFVLGGLEIDRHGATNLLGERRDGQWRRRGPGAIGTTSMAVLAARTMLYATRHDRAIFVERCSVVSAHGWHAEDPRAPAGPMLCLSPAGLFDFPAPDRRMRLLHTRPGWTPREVQQATGFPLAGLREATPLPAPTAEELEVLRGRVDREGRLR